jgi:type II secretory pathway pseudopilin PulG
VAFGLLLLIVIGVVGIVALLAGGFLMNRPKDRRGDS